MDSVNAVVELIPELFREAIAAHAILLGLDVSPDDIFVTPNAVTRDQPDRPLLGLVVKQGGFEFAMAIGPIGDMTLERLKVEWPQAVERVQQLTNEEFRYFLSKTRVRENSVALATAFITARCNFLSRAQLPSDGLAN